MEAECPAYLAITRRVCFYHVRRRFHSTRSVAACRAPAGKPRLIDVGIGLAPPRDCAMRQVMCLSRLPDRTALETLKFRYAPGSKIVVEAFPAQCTLTK
jgi:hypothetical protein